MKTKIIHLDDRDVEISKLPLGRFAELLRAIKELPKHISGLDNQSAEGIIQQLPFIVSESLPDVIAILAIATPLKENEIEELGLNEVVNLVAGVLEVNKFVEAYETIKKALAQPKAAKLTAITG